LVGAPVCAASAELSSMEIVSSMRSADSLEENTSSFYAELKRLKQVIATVETGKPTLFLLDEILKGTNSRDRHAGARALIRQLVASGGSGLVSTHDIELQDLSEELKGKVGNFSFHCDVSAEGKLEFDYTLREGVCHSMNATALMRAMGIEM
jgi:DNA mismatch repair ATPase MutS